MAVKDFRDLLIWQKAMSLAEAIYRVSHTFPGAESYGLTGQMRRAAISVASNIAEGHARESQREFARFLSIARGSLAELQTQLLLAERVGYSTGPALPAALADAEELGKMLRGMQRTLESEGRPPA